MLRTPVDLALSWHGQKLLEGQETVKNFEKAWHLQFEREKGRHLPNKLLVEDALFYGKVASVGSQLESVLSVFPREQAKIIFYEDFVSETKKIYEDVLEFLDIPSDGRSEFPMMNAGRSVRYPAIVRLLRYQSGWLDSLRETLRRTLGFNIPERRRVIHGVFVSNKGRPQPKSFRRYLAGFFEKEISWVEKITGPRPKCVGNRLKLN